MATYITDEADGGLGMGIITCDGKSPPKKVNDFRVPPGLWKFLNNIVIDIKVY